MRLRWTPGLLLAAIIFAALLARLPLVALPGHGYDRGFFVGWTEAVHEKGLDDAQEATPPVDYPALPVLLWPIAELYGPFLDEPAQSDEVLARLVKLPGVVGDLLMVAALFFFTRSLARRSPGALTGPIERFPIPGRVLMEDRAGLLASLVFAFNPAVIYGSALWGQIDSLIGLAMLGALAATMARRPGLGGMAVAVGFALTPQVLVIAPAILIGSLFRSGPRALAWLTVGFAAGLVLALGFFVINAGGDEILATYRRISGYQDHVSYNAWNIWWPAEVGDNPLPGDPALQLVGYAVPYRLLGLAALVPAGVILFCSCAPPNGVTLPRP